MLPQARYFPCPGCGEMITGGAGQCRFCAITIDAESAQAAATTQAKVNQACSDASFLRQAAVVMWGFLGLSFIPFVPLVGYGFVLTFLVVIFLFARWQWRFGGLRSHDPDFGKAQVAKNVSLLLWVAALVVGLIMPLAVNSFA